MMFTPLKRTISTSATISLFMMLALCTVPVRADDAEAREIMTKVEKRDDGDNRITNMEMTLIDKHGKERVRRTRTHRKDKGKDTLKLMFFMHTANVKNTGFMTYDYDDPEKDDDQWLYLPALKKTKRIATTDKSRSFMGSDFTYSDMTSRNLEDYDFKIVKTQAVNEVNTWIIEALPKNEEVIEETGYTKSLLFVRQDNHVAIRAVHFVRDGNLLKYMDVKKLELIDKIWVATEIHMTTKKGKATLHKTILKHHDVKFGQDLDESFFTVRRLEKGL